MDFALTPEQELLRQTAREVMTKTSPASYVRAMMADPRGGGDAEWRRLAALGWQGLVFPEAYGGSGLSMVELAIVLAEMGRVVMPGPFLSTVLGGLALAYAGSDAQRARWLPGICDGTVRATVALVEASERWDAEGVQAAARPQPGGLVLAGTKLFVPDAHVADVIVAAVRRSDDARVVLVAVERETAGLGVTPLAAIDQTRKLSAIAFDEVRVAADHVLPGAAAAGLARLLAQAGAALAAEMCGGAERVLELTVEYAKVRQQFGRPIGSFQAIQHRCADMMVAVETAKIAACYGAWAVAENTPDAARAAATAKALASDAYRRVTADAIQVHGGIGFTWEHDLHLYYRRAQASAAAFGDAAWNRELVARELGL